MTKILCAIDDTEHSSLTVEFAGRLVGALGGELAVVTINQLIGGYGRGSTPTLQWSESEADRILKDGAAEAQKAGAAKITVICIESRDPAQAIISYAEENGYDHIVLGTGGKGVVTRLVLGSVSRDVVYRAHCPVTVVR